MDGDFEKAQYKRDDNWGIVFTQEQFDLYEKNRSEIWRGFEDDIRRKTIVFVGT